jgi:hypothetical protein
MAEDPRPWAVQAGAPAWIVTWELIGLAPGARVLTDVDAGNVETLHLEHLMKARCWSMSCLEWMTSDTRRNSGLCPTTNGSAGSGTMQPTSTEMRSRLLAQATTKKRERSSTTTDRGAGSNTRHDKPTMACTTSTDQSWASRFETASNTLKRSREKSAPACRR